MWGMTAMTKGTSMKDKKKRAAAGGGGGGGGGSAPAPNIVNPIEGAYSKTGFNNTHSYVRLTVTNLQNNQAARVPNGVGSVTDLQSYDMDDYVATGIRGITNHAIPGQAQIDGEITLQALTDYRFQFGAYLPHNGGANVLMTLSAISDPQSIMGTAPNPNPNQSFTNTSIDTKASHLVTVGSVILKLTHNGVGFTTNTDSDVIAGNTNCGATDTFYLKVNFA